MIQQPIEPTLSDVITKLDILTQDVERSNERFEYYQKANQFLVNLAFGLIASATIAVIVTTVFKG